jgi:hypothetical protein
MFGHEEMHDCKLSAACCTLIYLAPARSPDRYCCLRRHAVWGDYDYTSLRHLRSHFGRCTL